ncbi:MAG: hypothetical protein JJT94_07300 [Bernardetiaceae bacterium]|nr:hypothetical protein [Bernardetiaceae bacterium]
MSQTTALHKAYHFIASYYGNQKAKRSGVYLINHIDEGLQILQQIQASSVAQKAYCLHPLVQLDSDLEQNQHLLIDFDVPTIIAVIEYRSVANAYLSRRSIHSIEDIRLSPLKDVNDMLIADKIQNRKDFEQYHKETHPRSAMLLQYFHNWFERLGISESFYQDCVKFLSQNKLP